MHRLRVRPCPQFIAHLLDRDVFWVARVSANGERPSVLEDSRQNLSCLTAKRDLWETGQHEVTSSATGDQVRDRSVNGSFLSLPYVRSFAVIVLPSVRLLKVSWHRSQVVKLQREFQGDTADLVVERDSSSGVHQDVGNRYH